MAQLTKEAENKIAALLIAEGLADGNLVSSVINEIANTDQPILAELIRRKIINNSYRTTSYPFAPGRYI